MYYVYIIYSNTVNKKYIGQTDDFERRLNEHNNGLLGTFTKNKGPWKLVHLEEFETRSQAMIREKYLKSGVGREWIKLNFQI